jgi:hypothetical protein
MSLEKKDLIVAFENSNRKRYVKLFDYYQAWFVDSNYLSIEVARKINAELGTTISGDSIRYIRSKIMKKRLEEISKKVNQVQSYLENQPSKIVVEPINEVGENFEFKEPKSINHNQEIVTIRKSKHETD